MFELEFVAILEFAFVLRELVFVDDEFVFELVLVSVGGIIGAGQTGIGIKNTNLIKFFIL